MEIKKPQLVKVEAFVRFFLPVLQHPPDACLKYLKTKFARTLLGILKVTQDNSKETWKHVPMQDFSKNSDIDWSKSVEEIDAQLYKKYNLTQPEIDFIESMIKPM